MEEQQELPQGWVLTKLGEVLTRITNGYALPQINEAFEKSLPITRIETISQGTIDLEKVKYVEAPSEEKVEQYKLRQGDVLFSHINSDKHLGKTAYFDVADITLLHGINLLLMRFTDAVSSKYAHYLFNHYRAAGEFIKIAQRAVNQSSINQKKLNQLAFPLPSLPEQRRIVAKLEELFSKLDAGVVAVRRTQALLKRYRQSVLHAAVTGELTRAWREAHPAPAETGAALLERIRAERRAQWEAAQVAKRGGQLPLGEGWKSKYVEPEAPDTSELPDLPHGWAWAILEQISDLDVGFAFKSEQFSKQGIRLLRGENIEPGALRWKDVRYWPEDKAESFEKYLIQEGEVILAMDRPLISSGLKLARAKSSDLPCLLVQRMARFRPVEVGATSYLYFFLQTQQAISHLLGGQTGTQLPHISGRGIVSMPLPLPPLVEQHQIIEEVERRLSVLDELEHTLTDELKRAERLRQSILHRAFTGRLVPQNATDEPAAALLARLQATPATSAKAKPARGRKAVAQQTTLGL